jgi:hypothetical protein
MGEIDDPHHAKNDGQADADQRQAGNGIKDLIARRTTRSTFTFPFLPSPLLPGPDEQG